MLTNLDAENAGRGRDLHRVLRDRLFVDLSLPERRVGDRYHTESEIAENFNVSRNTVRRAIAGLEAAGYVSRRRGVGIIIERKPYDTLDEPSGSVNVGERHRVIVVLPHWNDSPEGFFSRHFLKEISSPALSPPLAVEIRHYNDTLTLEDVDGAAVIAVDPTNRMLGDLTRLQHQGARIIVVTPSQPQPSMITLQSDQRRTVHDAVKRLYDLGHRRIGLMNHDISHMYYARSLVGFHEAHRDLNLPMPPGAVCQEMRYETFNHEPDVKNITAWICTYLASVDRVAQACHRAKLRVPEDVSLISFDDPGSAPHPLLQKTITCVVPDYREFVSQIHARLTDWQPQQTADMHLVSDIWIERESVAPPRT